MGSFRFDRFHLDSVDRRLRRDGEPVELNPRYFDALALLVREAGKLVSKDRFMAEVWHGIPVTDEALTQCIRTLRRQLGDDAASPRFIATVPKHGYRFIAPVESADAAAVEPTAALPRRDWRRVALLGAAGTVGGGIAGLLGGVIYGFIAASGPLAGIGAASVLLVVAGITLLIGLIGAAGVAFGIAAAKLGRGGPPQWPIAGGALGGLIVGAVVKLLGVDAFNLLLGRAPGDITGPFEGALLGCAVGLGAWLASRNPATSPRRGAAMAGLTGGIAGLLIPPLGGRMMAGSLDLLAGEFPGSRLRLDAIGGLFGERGLGPISEMVTGGLEGALFGSCVVGAMLLARRSLESRPPGP